MLKTYMFVLCMALINASVSAMNLNSAEDDRVVSLDALPGWPSANDTKFGIYSGFINIQGTSKNIHYIFLESQKNATEDPIVIWFNGGPGCSSMLGLLQETGPYVLMEGDTNYTANEWAWNKEANILYIEQPAGVGYSTCDNVSRPEDCVHTDNSSAHDNLLVLLGWLERFKDKPYGSNQIYLSGESYAGVYVPLLANQIYEYNQNLTDDANKINLTGFMVGNGVTNWTYDTYPATYDVLYYRLLMSQQLRDNIEANKCNFSGVAIEDFSNISSKCLKYSDEMMKAFTGINIYNIYGKCWNFTANTTNFTASDIHKKLFGKVEIDGVEHYYRKFYSADEYTPWLKHKGDGSGYYGIPECIWAMPAAEHLNDMSVRAQLNIQNNQVWRMCTVDGESTFSYSLDAKASQWAYEALKDTPVRMMHFSGDKDASVPTIGTQRWIDKFSQTTVAWKQWSMADNQVGGYYESYEGDLTLITVHGAGHMVPQDQREKAYHILFNWLFQRGEFKAQPSEPQFITN